MLEGNAYSTTAEAVIAAMANQAQRMARLESCCLWRMFKQEGNVTMMLKAFNSLGSGSCTLQFEIPVRKVSAGLIVGIGPWFLERGRRGQPFSFTLLDPSLAPSL